MQSRHEGTTTDYEAMTMDCEGTKTSGSQPSSNGFKLSSLSISTGNGCDFQLQL